MSSRTVVTCDECGTDGISPVFLLELSRGGTDGLYDRGYRTSRELCEVCGERVIAALGLPANNRGSMREADRPPPDVPECMCVRSVIDGVELVPSSAGCPVHDPFGARATA